jgi:hypothetical protein
MKKFSVILIALLLVACAPSPQAIQAAIAQTQSAWTPIPTPTSTLIPLSKIDLKSILVLPEDLPAGFSGANVSDPPSGFNVISGYTYGIYQQFERGEDPSGGVAVFLYDTIEARDWDYSILVKKSIDDGSFDTTLSTLIVSTNGQVPKVGERATYVTVLGSSMGIDLTSTDLFVARCHALISIRMSGIGEVDPLSTYARKLDNRLQPIVCRP